MKIYIGLCVRQGLWKVYIGKLSCSYIECMACCKSGVLSVRATRERTCLLGGKPALQQPYLLTWYVRLPAIYFYHPPKDAPIYSCAFFHPCVILPCLFLCCRKDARNSFNWQVTGFRINPTNFKTRRKQQFSVVLFKRLVA